MTVTYHAAQRAAERIGVKLCLDECRELGVQIIDRRPVRRRPDGKAEYQLDLRGGIPVRAVFDGVQIVTMWLDEWALLRRRHEEGR